MNTTDDIILDPEAAAAYLKITRRHLRELVARREIPVTRVGRLLRFRRSGLDAYLAAATTPATRGPLGGDAT